MDISKLPRLSGDQQTPPQPAPAPQQPGHGHQEPSPSPAAPVPVAINPGEAWISVAVGAILMYLGRSFAAWLIATISGRSFDTGIEWTTGEKAGEMVPYWQITGHYALSESAIFLFGMVMVLEAVSLIAASLMPRAARSIIATSLLLCAGMTLYNAVVVAVMISSGLPIVSMFAVAYGGYTIIWQWGLLKRLWAA